MLPGGWVVVGGQTVGRLGGLVEIATPPNGLHVLKPTEIGKFCRDRKPLVMDGVMMRRVATNSTRSAGWCRREGTEAKNGGQPGNDLIRSFRQRVMCYDLAINPVISIRVAAIHLPGFGHDESRVMHRQQFAALVVNHCLPFALQLASHLRNLEVKTFVSHSSVLQAIAILERWRSR
jgi:hypothetical protein